MKKDWHDEGIMYAVLGALITNAYEKTREAERIHLMELFREEWREGKRDTKADS